MSLGAKVASITRPAKAVCKPSIALAEHRMRIFEEGIVKNHPAPPTHEKPKALIPKDDGYAWGVKWPGHSMTSQPDVDWAGMRKAWCTWDKFTLGGSEFWGGMVGMTFSIVAQSLPGKKH